MTRPAAATGGARKDAARIAMERSNLYGFLAVVYRAAPTAALVRHMKEPSFLQALATAGGTLEAGFFDRPEDELIEDLAVEYTRLFLGPGKHIPPYSTVHLAGEGASLWGASTAWVRRFIEAAGFDLESQFRTLPDHIAIEFEFMQEMTRREATAWEQRDNAGAQQCQRIEAEFIAVHLIRWVPAFCDKVAAAAELPFYREVALVTAGFVASEYDDVGASADAMVTPRRSVRPDRTGSSSPPRSSSGRY